MRWTESWLRVQIASDGEDGVAVTGTSQSEGADAGDLDFCFPIACAVPDPKAARRMSVEKIFERSACDMDFPFVFTAGPGSGVQQGSKMRPGCPDTPLILFGFLVIPCRSSV